MLSMNCETLFIHLYNFTPFLILSIEKVELFNKILKKKKKKSIKIYEKDFSGSNILI